MKQDAVDMRQVAILHSAWEAFSTYGFRKTSMDDIARGAGMSRTALYLHFKNKDDICRSLTQFYYDKTAAAIEAALRAEGAPTDQLIAAFHAQVDEEMIQTLASPHGIELMDAGLAVARDVKQAGEARFAAIYARWLTEEAAAGRMDLDGSPEDVARTITASIKGLKSQAIDLAPIQPHLTRLARLLAQGMETER